MSDIVDKLHIHNEKTLEILNSLPNHADCIRASDIFSLLSDVTRLKILWVLCHSEECVSNIATITSMSMPAISFHLRYLRQSSIITFRKIGKENHYKLNDTPYAKLVHQMIDNIFEIDCYHD